MTLRVDSKGVRLAACALAVFLAIPASLKAAPLTYDCDTTPDHFSQLSQVVSGGAYAISGEVKLGAPYKGRYLPSATIFIGSEDGRRSVSFKVIDGRDQKGKLHTVLAVKDGELKQADLGLVEASTAIPFKLTLSTSGQGSLEISGKPYTIDFVAPSTAKLSVSCSTADFQFNDLVMTPQ